ncbi:TPA: hypothetical protein EYP66_02335 [Candidatus Poribacteria bacterium]|nr:hypothetical protein [Candidatus Poribacteria bacterium]
MVHRLLYFQYLVYMIFLSFGIDVAADDYFNRITAASNGRLTRFTHSPITLYVGSIPDFIYLWNIAGFSRNSNVQRKMDKEIFSQLKIPHDRISVADLSA